jgi:hypothetical protein
MDLLVGEKGGAISPTAYADGNGRFARALAHKKRGLDDNTIDRVRGPKCRLRFTHREGYVHLFLECLALDSVPSTAVAVTSDIVRKATLAAVDAIPGSSRPRYPMAIRTR